MNLQSSIPTPSHYVKWGFRPTPLAAGMKFPRLKGWPTRTATPEDWQPGEGIGLVCGLQPDGTYLVCLDFDHRPDLGVDADEQYNRFMDALGMDLESKVFATRSTSGNGRHVYIKVPREIRKGKLSYDGKTVGDLLGTGAQVVAQPPTRWEWRRPYRIELLTDDELDQVLQIINYQPEPEKHTYVAPERTGKLLRPGDDYNRRGREHLLNKLVERGYTIVRRIGIEVQLRRPGKSSDVSVTLDHFEGVFHCFTSSTAEFEIGESYSYFKAYTFLVHGGDFRASAADLASQGFGEPVTDRKGIRQKAYLAGTSPTRPVGRPKSLGHIRLYNVLVANAIGVSCAMTNQQLADACSVSTSTIERWLGKLKAAGMVTCRYPASGRWIDIQEVSDETINMGGTGLGRSTSETADSGSGSVLPGGVADALDQEEQPRTSGPVDERSALGSDNDLAGTEPDGLSSGYALSESEHGPQAVAPDGGSITEHAEPTLPNNSVSRVRAHIWKSIKLLTLGGVRGGTIPGEAQFAICDTCNIGEMAPDEQDITRCSYCEQAVPVASLVNEATLLYEQVRRPQRGELVRQYVTSNGRPDAEPELIDRLTNSITASRKQVRADERYAAKLRELPDRKLAARERSAAVRAEEFRAVGKYGQEYVWRRFIHLINQEQERREPIRARLKPQRKNLFGEVVL